MEGSGHDLSQCVQVAVNIRPLITSELMIGCTDCITVVPGEPQVQIGSHSFTFDYVYGNGGSSLSGIFSGCVAPLVDAIFNGYNATVLAYGQTGSGKTYTMGTNYNGEASNEGIIPKVMEAIFSRVDGMKDSSEFLIRVSFIEIFKEEVFDLFDPNPPPLSKGEGGKPAIPARVPIQIRETTNGGITLSGVNEVEVSTKEEMASYLSRGSLSRATGSTNMNSQSSRSHAIFTITMEQKKNVRCPDGTTDDFSDDILCAKLHLVDLAGSERAKRTGADGMRFKEGIHINKGLLALGNVISALGDEKKRKEGGHVPYRDSKLTRLLQDSLGGNSKTVMIACVSPADTNAEETLNTLKYANRARNIQNKAVINRDPLASQMQKMRSQIEHLQTELLFFRGDGGAPFEELQILKHKISLLEASNAELQRKLQERRITCDQLTMHAFDAQVEKDKLILKIESARNGKPWDEIDNNSDQGTDLLKTYLSKIQELEAELLRIQSFNRLKRSATVEFGGSDEYHIHTKEAYFTIHELSSMGGSKATAIIDESDDEEKELEHCSLQEKLDRELKELDRKLELKEAEMKRFGGVDTTVLKHHYEKKVQELEQEKRALQKEIDELRHNLASISFTSDDGAQKLKEEYLQKLNFLEVQVSELKKKQEAQAQLLRQKQKSDQAAKKLQDEIQKIKTQKVQLQHKIKQESEQFRLWKASREKEVLQLKKEGRRNEYEMHKLIALNQRQKMVLQRKTEEASMATKRLKELLESRKTSSRDLSGGGNGNGYGNQALIHAIEHELEVTLRVHEVRAAYERQMEERARMAKEVAKLKEEAELLKQEGFSSGPQAMSPGARTSRIFALENMLSTTSSTLVSMASQLSEAEERERGFCGRGRWNQVRSLADAKNLMNYLFNLASSSRCLLRDKEVDCIEKDSEIRELKEKVVNLSSLVKQLETQKAKLFHKMKSQTGFPDGSMGEHRYHLRKSNKDFRSSILLFEDMDTSESESSAVDPTDDDWVESGKRPAKKRNSKTGTRASIAPHPCDEGESGNSRVETSAETTANDFVAAAEKTDSGLCCSCSKKSLCKTTRCECRAVGRTCAASCGCLFGRCSNREAVAGNELRPAILEGTEHGSDADENDKSRTLASQGAMLLQSAFSGKADDTTDEDGGPKRKPLSDIGNTVVKSNAPKPPGQRKKWRKSVIQLVRAPLPPARPENSASAQKPENNASEADIPLKPPRAMRLAASNFDPLKEKNSGQAGESGTKGPDAQAQANPVRHTRVADEKENHGT